MGVAMGLPGAGLAQECPPFAEPVISLGFDSRYAQDDETRSEIDPDSAAEVEEQLEPLYDFITDLTTRTDSALTSDDAAKAGCVMAELASWARADALSDLDSQTAELTIGSRLAALALIAGQVAPAGTAEELALVRDWLTRRMDAQMAFWETAPEGSAMGNLRAWAGLAGASVALVTDDPVTRGWAAWSINYVACTANEDGSLPQEMGRGELSLHYQLHAVAPLAVAAAVLEQQGVPMTSRCNRALDRIVGYTVRDLIAGGAETQARTGVPQTLSGGMGDLKDFQLAWAEAWLRLRSDSALKAAIAPRRPLRYSKLGGDQTRIWAVSP